MLNNDFSSIAALKQHNETLIIVRQSDSTTARTVVSQALRLYWTTAF